MHAGGHSLAYLPEKIEDESSENLGQLCKMQENDKVRQSQVQASTQEETKSKQIKFICSQCEKSCDSAKKLRRHCQQKHKPTYLEQVEH